MSTNGNVHVYFIKPVEMPGPVKIGATNQPISRLKYLGYWSPIKLELIGAVRGSVKDEFFLHRCFAHIHSHHEWFTSTPELLSAIDGILKFGIEFARSNLVERGHIRKRVYSRRALCADDFLQGVR